MTDIEAHTEQTFSKTVVINADAARVWDALTIPEQMQQWMTETKIEVRTDWQVGQPITISGDWYKTGFENSGIILHYDPATRLCYTHLSSLSRLPDVSESYSVLDFTLTPTENTTALTITLSNFPTETIYRHLAFYWNVAIELLKRFVEGKGLSPATTQHSMPTALPVLSSQQGAGGRSVPRCCRDSL
jgi:uncharacterized protein YndB with AHSA1/START domain